MRTTRTFRGVKDPLSTLRAAVEEAAGAIGGTNTRPTLERPKQAGFGDYSTNAAMLLAPAAGRPPREVAAELAEVLRERLGADLGSFEVAGPGFLNLVMDDRWFGEALAHVLDAGDAWGGGGAPARERVDVEFVSANPTGPMHVGHARNAAYGDAVSRILEFVGHEVTREFYVNDYGSQIAKLGESIQARARGEEVPADGYQGEYVAELAAQLEGADSMDPRELGWAAVELNLERMRRSLENFRVAPFDVWFSERSLHEGSPSRVDEAFARLDERGETYRSEGALWLRTSAHGDDKDRVLERSSGEHTYFASDLGYLLDKQARAFDRMLLVLGADHHGYMARMQAAFDSLGGVPGGLELLIMQFVHLVDRGERSSMSKRRGEFVTLDDLVEEIGVDAARWFLLARSHDTTIDLDMALAKEESAENPVYYVQYAHARIASVLAKAGEERVAAALAAPARASGLEPSERALVKKLLAFPDEVADAADRRAPHRLASYALELAQEFTAFYRDCRVVGAEPEELESFRLALSVATKRTIGRALDLLGVSAPESM
jgi:arginyl-tRNA synthetase